MIKYYYLVHLTNSTWSVVSVMSIRAACILVPDPILDRSLIAARALRCGVWILSLVVVHMLRGTWAL